LRSIEQRNGAHLLEIETERIIRAVTGIFMRVHFRDHVQLVKRIVGDRWALWNYVDGMGERFRSSSFVQWHGGT